MTSPEIDPLGALRSLGFEPAGECRRVEGGWATAIWHFKTADGKAHSLRAFRPEAERAATRERIAMSFVAGAGLPAPVVEASGEWEGRAVMVLSWLPGVNLVDAAAKRPWQVWRLGSQMGALQAKIHAIAPPDELKADAPERWLGRAGANYPEVRALIEASMSGADSFLHMDYHPLNLLTDGKEITGILDWTTATAGDRRADLALTSVLLKLAPIPPGALRPLLKFARSLVHTSWRRAYRKAAGWPPGMAPFYARAGTVFVNENLSRVDRDEVWATEADFEPFDRWIAEWTARARRL